MIYNILPAFFTGARTPLGGAHDAPPEWPRHPNGLCRILTWELVPVLRYWKPSPHHSLDTYGASLSATAAPHLKLEGNLVQGFRRDRRHSIWALLFFVHHSHTVPSIRARYLRRSNA